jgi:sulfite exporter TauE/SafE
MLAFGIGTSVPLLVLAMTSREALLRWRCRLIDTGSTVKAGLGALLVVAGVLTLTGLDRSIQTALEGLLPGWILSLSSAL